MSGLPATLETLKREARDPATNESRLLEIAQADEALALQIARARKTSPGVLETLADHHSARVRSRVAGNAATPPAVLDALSRESAVGQSKRVAQNPASPASALDRLTAHPQASVRAALVDAPAPLPASVLALLAADPDVDRDHLCTRHAKEIGAAPAAIAVLLGDEDPRVRASLARTVPLDEATARRLFEDSDPTVAGAMISNPDIADGDTWVERLVTHPDPRVRAATARRDWGETRYPRYLADPDPLVRAGIAWRIRLDEELIAAFAADEPIVREALASRFELPPPVLEALVRDPDARVRARVALHDRLTGDLRDALAADAEALVRLMVAGSGEASFGRLVEPLVTRLSRLAEDPSTAAFELRPAHGLGDRPVLRFTVAGLARARLDEDGGGKGGTVPKRLKSCLGRALDERRP